MSSEFVSCLASKVRRWVRGDEKRRRKGIGERALFNGILRVFFFFFFFFFFWGGGGVDGRGIAVWWRLLNVGVIIQRIKDNGE